jgi:hypothetical protein
LVPTTASGITVSNVGAPRLLYYQDANGDLRELNNTGTTSEVWIANVTFTTDYGNRGTAINSTYNLGPTGMVVTPAMTGTRLSMAAGFRGVIQQIYMFYQLDGSDVQVRIRDADSAGD